MVYGIFHLYTTRSKELKRKNNKVAQKCMDLFLEIAITFQLKFTYNTMFIKSR